MPLPPIRRLNPQPQGISLDELAEAFAQVMGVEPRRVEPRRRPPDSGDAVGRCGAVEAEAASG